MRTLSLSGLIAVTACLCSGVCAAADEQAKESEQAANDRLRLEDQRRLRIDRSRPRRAEGTLRYENLSDIETREILAVSQRVFPGLLLNIAGVTTGCPCEDGPDCTAQVWVVAHQVPRTVGLMLSRIDEQWVLGPVQKWWLRRERLDRELRPQFRNRASWNRWTEYSVASEKLYREFPDCALDEESVEP